MTPKRLIAAGLLFAVVAGLVGGLVVVLLGDDDDDDKSTTSTPSASAQTTTTLKRPDPAENPEAAELFDLVTAFTELTIHAKYRVSVVAQPDRSQLMEIWQKDGQSRQEAVIEDATGPKGSIATLYLEDRVVLCQKPVNGSYTCGLVSESEKTAFESLRTNLLAGIEGQQVSVRDTELEGRAVRCFTVATPATSELCVTADGVLARISAQEGSFDLLEYDTTVDDSVFIPPAEPGAG